MSRLYSVTSKLDELVRHFQIDVSNAVSVPSETIEGTLGLVVHEKDGIRYLKSITWGFPRVTRAAGDGANRIGLVADLTNSLWDRIVVEPRYRCLIPITHFANPDGTPGKKTRTWFSARREPLLVWAGFCRNTERGPVYAGMTMTANEAVRPFNDRMPALLRKEEWEKWLHGDIKDVIQFQFREPIPAEELEVTQTHDLWRSGIPPRNQSFHATMT